jgi:pimeloyl-ACP methyl ester carboxylesterase
MSTLIFIPGSGDSSLAWHYQVEAFPQAKAVDLPGHPQGEPCPTIEQYTEWLNDYILSNKYEPAILAGHSMGGAIAQMHAIKYPENTTALILIGTGARLRVDPALLSMIGGGITNPEKWFNDVVKPFYKDVPAEAKEPILERIKENGAKVQLNDMLCCDKFDIMDELEQIRVPTLIICGSKDILTPPKYSSYLASRINGAKLVIVDEGGHLVFGEKPRAVNQAIGEFLANLQ